MNRFIRKSLEPGERIVYSGRLHWSYTFAYTFWAVVLVLAALVLAVYGAFQEENNNYFYYGALALLVVALVIWIIGRLVHTRCEFVVTATRFIQKDGIFDISMTEIPLFKVETVNFHQTFFQRMIGTGKIELVGSGGTCHSISRIASPMDVRRAIVSAINADGRQAALEDGAPVGQQSPAEQQTPTEQPSAVQQPAIGHDEEPDLGNISKESEN
ncbi:MAG: PH domain-containing protein [Prevotellaceae bacterium]|nr:PH domain-containing protein [Prevotellaceae bacterium]